MGNFASEIDRIKDAKSAIKAAIEEKGVPIDGEILIDGYADAIGQIPNGTDVSGVTVTENDMLSGKIAVDKDGKTITGNIPTVTATLSGNVVTVPQGHIASKQTLTVAEAAAPTTSGNIVTVNKGYVPEQKKITVGTAKAATTITPNTEDQTVAAGTFLTGALTVKGEANFAEENIAEGVTMWGKVGTHKGGGSIEFFECASVAADGASWSGRKATQGADGSWSFASALTNELTVAGYYPVVGRVYSADTTVWARDLYVAQEGKMVLLCHFDTQDKYFMDATDTCFVINESLSFRSPGKFGDYCVYGSGSYAIKIENMPETDAFTLEMWINAEGDDERGYEVIYMPETDGKPEVRYTPTKLSTKAPKNVWHHYAYVRRAATGIVEEYVDGQKVGESAFDKAIGGRGVQIYRGVSGFYSQCDELAMFDYAKYTANFTPPAAPYNDIVSGLNRGVNPAREVKVSGCINRFVNDPSFALVDPNATGYNRIWVTSDGKYYIFCSWDYCAWIIANKTDFFQFDFVCYARLNVASGEDWMEVEPIGHGGWKEEGTSQPISVVYN